MTAHTPILQHTEARTLEQQAYAILAGSLAALPAHEHDWFSPEEWREAAQSFVDRSDRTALPRCLKLDREYQEFKQWEARDYERRQYCDFLTWHHEKEAWSRLLAKTPVKDAA